MARNYNFVLMLVLVIVLGFFYQNCADIRLRHPFVTKTSSILPPPSGGGEVGAGGSCSMHINQALIDTHTWGENAWNVERTMGHTPYIDSQGTHWLLASVGNEIVSFKRKDDMSWVRMGKSDTGLSGSGHDPYQLEPDAVLARDEFNTIFLIQQGGLWFVRASDLGNSTIHATSIHPPGPAVNYALLPLDGGKMAMVMNFTGGIGNPNRLERWLIHDPSQSSINSEDPSTWVKLITFASNIGQQFVKQIESNGRLKSGFEKILLVDVKEQNKTHKALIDGTSDNPNVVQFPVTDGNPNAQYGDIRFGLIGTNIYAAHLTQGNPTLFKITLNSGVPVIEQVGQSIPKPTETNVNGTPISFSNCQVVSERGVLACSDFQGGSLFVYDVHDPSQIGPTTQIVRSVMEALVQNFPPPYNNTSEIVGLGGGHISVSALGYFFVFSLDNLQNGKGCDVAQ